METADILVVAADAAFRRSIAFALESEGFHVVQHRAVAPAFGSPEARRTACAVVDDDAIDDWEAARVHFAGFAKPVILLVSFLRTVPDLPFASRLSKPFLGEPLIEAVRAATAGGRSHPK